jgi:hypothetical protein
MHGTCFILRQAPPPPPTSARYQPTLLQVPQRTRQSCEPEESRSTTHPRAEREQEDYLQSTHTPRSPSAGLCFIAIRRVLSRLGWRIESGFGYAKATIVRIIGAEVLNGSFATVRTLASTGPTCPLRTQGSQPVAKPLLDQHRPEPRLAIGAHPRFADDARLGHELYRWTSLSNSNSRGRVHLISATRNFADGDMAARCLKNPGNNVFRLPV